MKTKEFNVTSELEKIAQDMRKKERELWAGNPSRMGNGAVVLDVPEPSLDAVKAALTAPGAEISGRRGASLDVARSQYTKLKKTRARPAACARWALFAAKCAAEDLFRRD